MRSKFKKSQQAIQQFIQLWKGLSITEPQTFLSEFISLSSSHRGNSDSCSNVIQHLKHEFTPNSQVDIHLTNLVKKSLDSKIKISAYFYGNAIASQKVFFGGMITFTLQDELIQEVKIQLNWVEGEKNLLPGWTLPMERLWKPNDPISVISSELDTIWRGGWLSEAEDQTRISEAWYRYAWALDFADTELYIDTFTEDAIAELPPMGLLKGKRQIISTLKAFRMPWPSIQHYGEPLHIKIDNNLAQMVLGRIIPIQNINNSGEKIYAAHYLIELQRDSHSNWKIHSMKYIPGWIRKN